MDVSKLVLVVALVYAVNEGIKRKLPAVWAAGDIFISLAVGVGAAFLVATTVWAHSEVFRNVALDNMNVGSKIVAGLLVGAGAVFASHTFDAVKNIGSNQVKRPFTKPNHTNNPVAGTGLRGVHMGDIVTPPPTPRSVNIAAGLPQFPDGVDNGYPGNVTPSEADVDRLGKPVGETPRQ